MAQTGAVMVSMADRNVLHGAGVAGPIDWQFAHDRWGGAGLLTFGVSEAEIARRVWGQAYLATPFSGRAVGPGGFCPFEAAAAAADASAAMIRLRDLGVSAVSPVVMAWAACCDDAGLDPLAWGDWMAWGQRMLEASRAVVVPAIEGWDTSLGVWIETCHALAGMTRVYVVDRPPFLAPEATP